MTLLTRQHPAPHLGVVHFGPGAFFRAHVAVYLDDLMQQAGGDWGITAVSLKSTDARDKLAPQEGLYTVVERGPDAAAPRVVTSLREVLVAQTDAEAVLAGLDQCKLVTLTITEKGYCHIPATGRLNLDHPDIAADLLGDGAPRSALGFIVQGLARRKKDGRRAFTVLSCDNLAQNGALLRGLVLELAARVDPELAAWIGAEACFPSSMVDRIVPAVMPDFVAEIARMTGVSDAAPVQCEPFRQWVIEDDFVPGTRPALDLVGAQMVGDVVPFEHMKLRMLNATHSALAYLGYLAGFQTIADTVANPHMARFALHLWQAEIIPVLDPPPGVDLHAYATTLMTRYANPGIQHRTWQIAMDGSQKLPQRILGTLGENLARGHEPQGLFLAVAAWMRFSSGVGLDGQAIEVRDPIADQLAAFWASDDVVGAYLALGDVFPEELSCDPRLRAGLERALERLSRLGAEQAAALPLDPSRQRL